MGIVKKVGITGIGLIVGIVAISFLAKRTNILSTVTSGLTNTGNALGRGIGGGLSGIFSGFWGGISGLSQAELDKNWKSLTSLGGLIPEPYADDGKSNAGDPSITPHNREYYDSLRNLTVTTRSGTRTITEAKPITVYLDNGFTKTPVQTVEIMTKTGAHSIPLVDRLRQAREAVDNYYKGKDQGIQERWY